ncbi:peptidoglycan-binding protein [Streptomyces sp. NPDC050504]|uniref:peptidoglycan-binding protein n=1 Tax=Streptomyces sp. NPDC050504 TaxID=3365618 RepID=UPI0037A35A2F
MKRTLTVLTTLAAAVGGILAGAPTASAADGTCTSTTGVSRGGYWTFVPTTGGGSTSCIMSRGANNDGVSELQRALAICYGLDVGAIDGIYGSKTESAVRWLQSRTGQKVDGVYGPNTRNAVSWRWYSNGGAICSQL